ncbi:hypothetical protein CGI77_09575 [Vibrio parahaemolyticus]|uniref:hypothetical protein n=1 Tax=Vibrio parahaemolyticus TaxID=670 RepID=UPI001120EA2F|nr:hypothetical protein [Vibrio parahaemolyticus]TOH58841.1 hypothetical protein CGI77_09575 [Vibrio parahaemolyticus]
MDRLVPSVIGSRREVFEHLTELGMIDDVIKLSKALGTQYRGISVEEQRPDASTKRTSYEVVHTERMR